MSTSAVEENLSELLLKALLNKRRFPYEGGSLSLEQLVNLPLTTLDKVVVGLKTQQTASEMSFLKNEDTKKNQELDDFNLALAVLNWKQDLEKSKRDKKTAAAEIAQLRSLLYQKEEEALSNLTADQLREKLRQLEEVVSKN